VAAVPSFDALLPTLPQRLRDTQQPKPHEQPSYLMGDAAQRWRADLGPPAR